MYLLAKLCFSTAASILSISCSLARKFEINMLSLLEKRCEYIYIDIAMILGKNIKHGQNLVAVPFSGSWQHCNKKLTTLTVSCTCCTQGAG